MLRKGLSSLVLLSLLTAAAWAGDIKTRRWPACFIPKDIAQIPVVMDIGYCIEIQSPTENIKLEQVSAQTYEGCADMRVNCNFDLSLRCSVAPTGLIPGQYSCFAEGAEIDAPGGKARVCVRLQEPNIAVYRGGSRDVHVATVTIQVTPRLL